MTIQAMADQQPSAAEFLSFYAPVTLAQAELVDWTLHLREQDRRLENYCSGLFAIAARSLGPIDAVTIGGREQDA